ncbi:MAG TPA: MMPL family transporter [Solirubrobacterales bacterium]
MRRVGDIVSGKRSKWVVAVVWLLLAVGLAGPSGMLADETDDSTESFLPRSAESKEALAILEEEFPGGDTENAIVVYHRDGGLTGADRAQIREDAEALKGLDTATGEATVPFEGEAGKAAVSSDGSAAFTTVLFEGGDQEKLADEGEAAADALGSTLGLEVYLSGSLGFSNDSAEVFEGLDTTLLIATATLVLILLLLIYRAPLIALMPLIVVGFSYMVATAIAYFMAKGGLHVDSQGTSILAVLMFGAGTDYCLLLVSRYREELRRQEDKHLAMARAVRRAGPAVLASGLTVVGALLVMLTADLGSTRSLGPIAAIGVFTVMIGSLTLLPALLTIFGRNGFWPRRRLIAYDPDHEIQERSLWRRFGLRIVKRPGLALLGSSAVLGIFCLGLLTYESDFNINSFFRDKPESVEGFEVLQADFPAGFLDSTTLLVERTDGSPITPEDGAAAVAIVEDVDGVASVTPGEVSEDGTIGRAAIVFEDDPYSLETLDLIPEIRSDLASGLGPGLDAKLGDASAIQYDYSEATEQDLELLAPLVLLVIFVILVILLRAVVAPLYLIATVIFSLFATLGVTAFVFTQIFGDAGFDTSLPTYAFIFLVALGVDYNIFLMSRVREEAHSLSTREAVVRALAATGPVITSAGIILAGTFAVLASLPVTFLLHLGFAVAFGVLLDTFIVRTIMVPAIAELVGDASWWPSGRKARGLVEGGEPEPAPQTE